MLSLFGGGDVGGWARKFLSVDVESLGMITAIRPDIHHLTLGNPALLDAFIESQICLHDFDLTLLHTIR